MWGKTRWDKVIKVFPHAARSLVDIGDLILEKGAKTELLAQYLLTASRTSEGVMGSIPMQCSSPVPISCREPLYGGKLAQGKMWDCGCEILLTSFFSWCHNLFFFFFLQFGRLNYSLSQIYAIFILGWFSNFFFYHLIEVIIFLCSLTDWIIFHPLAMFMKNGVIFKIFQHNDKFPSWCNRVSISAANLSASLTNFNSFQLSFRQGNQLRLHIPCIL